MVRVGKHTSCYQEEKLFALADALKTLVAFDNLSFFDALAKWAKYSPPRDRADGGDDDNQSEGVARLNTERVVPTLGYHECIRFTKSESHASGPRSGV